MPERYLEFKQGSTISLLLTVQREGAPVDITNAEIVFEARYFYGETPVIIGTKSGGEISIRDGPAGEAEIVIPPDASRSVRGSLSFDTWVYEQDGTATDVEWGTLHLLPASS